MKTDDPQGKSRELTLESQKMRLQFIQTVVVVIGLAFAVFEIWDKYETRQLARYQATSELLTKFADGRVVDGVTAFFDAANMEPTESNYRETLQRLAPTRQLYIAWSACASEGICLEGKSRDVMCSRILAYEVAFKEMLGHFGKAYVETRRQQAYLGEFENCKREALSQS